METAYTIDFNAKILQKIFPWRILGVALWALQSLTMQSFAQERSREQSRIALGPYIAAKAGINSINSAITSSNFVFANLPDVGAIALVSTSAEQDVRVNVMAGFVTYSAQNLSSNPFGGTPLTDFRLVTHLQYVRFGVGLRLNNVISIQFGYNVPIGGTYTSTVDLFQTGNAFMGEQTVRMPTSAMNSAIDAGLSLALFSLPIASGRLEFSIAGNYVLTSLARPTNRLDLTVILNQIGIDPLAGLRTLGVQPISVSVGAAYLFNL